MVKNNDLIKGLMSLLNGENKTICQGIVDCLTGLDYAPQRQKARGYVLNFKSRKTSQTIAKIGVHEGNNQAFFSLKFFACKNPPIQYKTALRSAIAAEKERYFCVDCGVCRVPAEERGYLLTYPDGRIFKRCSAYVVEIPDLKTENIEDFNNLLTEQHRYFLSLEQ